MTGIYSIAETIHRQLPSHSNDVTHETVHASVKRQDHIDPKLAEYLNNNPSLVLPLHPFEEEIRSTWKVSPERAEAYQHSKSVLQSSKVQDVAYAGSLGDHKDNEIIEVAEHVFKAGKLFGHNALQSLTHTKTVTKVDGKTAVEESWVGKILEESSMGPFIRELASRR